MNLHIKVLVKKAILLFKIYHFIFNFRTHNIYKYYNTYEIQQKISSIKVKLMF